MRLFSMSDPDGEFRVRHDSPRDAPGPACVILQSGQMGGLDEDSEERRLYDHLVGELSARGVGAVRLDMATRSDRRAPAADNHVASRAARVERVISSDEVAPQLESFVVCGLSLGAKVALRLAASRDALVPRARALILLSCVLEQPVTVMWDIASIHMIYGDRDHIAYVDETIETITPIPPSEYAADTAKLLLVKPKQKVETEIWAGYGHSMIRLDGGDAYGAARPLAALARSLLS